MGPTAWRRLRLAVGFIDAACRYWLTVYPLARRETWRRRARTIPDPALRAIALDTLRCERGNLEGAAAFAAFAPLRRRATVVRATVAFQVAYDYLDSLAEQPKALPESARVLHEALRVALRPEAAHPAYYRHHPHTDDGGYLRRLVETCRTATGALPSHRAIEPHLLRAVDRMIDYQALIHARGVSASSALAAWARTQRPPTAALTWWETAAAGASSLGVFALLAAAAHHDLSSDDATAMEGAYFPWIGALHVLLDSLADQPDDVRAGHHSLVEHYASAPETAARLGAIAATAFSSALALREGNRHVLLLAGMAAFYLSSPTARLPHAALARQRVLTTAGDLAHPTLAVLRGRREIGRVNDDIANALTRRLQRGRGRGR